MEISKTKGKSICETLSTDVKEVNGSECVEPVEFDSLVEKAISRRNFLNGGVVFGASAFVLGSGVLSPILANVKSSRLAFEPVKANSLDTVTVPAGYNWHTVMSWGDPLWSKGKSFDHASRGNGQSQELAVGDNNDGMALFQHKGRNIIAVNNEYVNRGIFHGNRASGKAETADDVRKSKAGHGITITEIAENGGKWSIVKDSFYNRRITADTPVEITGPAAGHQTLKTGADPSGFMALGTFNNCGNGRTPWGTYLTCEENFNGYFSASNKGFKQTKEMKRYGIKNKDRGYNWASEDERFDLSKQPNEINRHGYITEIDPLNPNSTPKKRTALGRFKHENAEVVLASNGHVVVYLGDDERGEFLYKFISKGKYVEGGDNRELLADGSLFVAKFSDNFSGKWVELTPRSTGFKSKAEICINTRIAASRVGATTMDRPEWVAAHPRKAEVYCALTNNKNRGKKPNAGGDKTPVGGPNPRFNNNYGQIVRWRPSNNDHTSIEFSWDLFVLAGNPTVHKDQNRGSNNITTQNIFNSPDGIAFDSNGLLWIQTDGKYSNKDDFAGMGNNQMLIGDPESGEIKRFMVGPKEAEVTGITWSGDRKTVFVGIQHPGEKGDSHFPEGGNTVPRSTVIAIQRNDGNRIG